MSLFTKVSQFAKSPQGKKALGEAQRLAKDPKTKRQLEQVRARFAKKPR